MKKINFQEIGMKSYLYFDFEISFAHPLKVNMPIDNAIFLIPVSTGIIFVIAGFIMLRFPPRKINGLYGYRTPSSMKSKDRWDFAQKYSSKEMMKLGVLLALSGLIGLIYQPNENTATIIGLGLMFLVVIALVIRVEAAIKKKFNTE